MVKKTVKLVPQERFDLIDAQALQQGTLQYLASALGNLMGNSNGLLSELIVSTDVPNKQILFENKFAFFVTTKSSEQDGTGYSGEVVLYDPDNPAQAIKSIDYTAAKNAKDAYFADGSLDAEGEDADESSRLLPIGDFAPFLWARPVLVEGQLDARRKWSVAQQTEVPVTMNTRTITTVEFAFSAAMPESASGTSPWAIVAKIIDWAGDTPRLLPISAFDGRKWTDRARIATIGDVDQVVGGIQRDWFSDYSPNLSSWNLFENFTNSDNVPVSLVYNMLINSENWIGPNDAQGVNGSISDRLFYLDAWLRLQGNQSLAQAGIRPYKGGLARPWNKGVVGASNGISDQLASIKAVIQNLMGDGIFDHGSLNLDNYPKLAPFLSADGNFRTLFSHLSGKFESHWTARPLRSLTSLALENMMLSDEVERLTDQVSDNQDTIRNLDRRVGILESEQDPFAEVPIANASPLVPALSVAFKADYGQNADFTCYAGPEGAADSVEFFVDANMHSQITYARGGVRIRLSNDTIQELGGISAISNGQIVIQATPVHYQTSGGWLFPHDPIGIGKVIVDNVQSDIVGHNDKNYVAESVVKKLGTPEPVTVVLRAFANFYQCTLNTCVFTPGDGTASIDIYPVNTVPDIVEGGHDLRGYPAFNGWVGRIGHKAAVDAGLAVNPGTQYDEQYPSEFTGIEERGDHQVEGSFFHGDTTNPENFAQNYGLGGIGTNNNANFSFDSVDIFGKMDDFRGYAHTMTFLRPDRFVADTVNVGGNLRPNSKGIVGYNSSHNVETLHSGVDRNGNVVDSKNHGDWANSGEAAVGANGRFMPSFSLVVYKNTFTSLGSSINDDSIKSVVESSIEYNSADTRDSDGNQPTGGDISNKPKR